jgi:hypothetical protein
MRCERPWRPALLECWERRIGFRLDVVFRAFDPVKEIILRLFPNDHLEALRQQMTSHRSLAWPFTPLRGLRLPTKGA